MLSALKSDFLILELQTEFKPDDNCSKGWREEGMRGMQYHTLRSSRYFLVGKFEFLNSIIFDGEVN